MQKAQKISDDQQKIENRMESCRKYWDCIKNKPHMSHPHMAFLLDEIQNLEKDVETLYHKE